MTCARRRVLVVFVTAAMASSVSACRVLQHAASPSNAPVTAAGDGLGDESGAGDTADCPFDAGEVSSALGGQWTVTSLPSGGGCNYTQGTRSILVSDVPLPKDVRGQHAAMAQTRKPCDRGSAQAVAPGRDAFVCRQGTLLEAVTTSGGHLLVVCTEAGSDPVEATNIRAALGKLVARA